MVGLDFVKQISAIYDNMQIEQNGPVSKTWIKREDEKARRDTEIRRFYEENKDFVDETLQKLTQ